MHNKKAWVIPEGGSMEASLPGALTLALDMIENERQRGLSIDHLFMDAGTGFSAIATLLALTYMNKNTRMHILLLAGSEEAFLANLKRFRKAFNQLLDCQLPDSEILERFQLYRPATARSFGHANQAVFSFIRQMARQEGFFTDPIYSAKLFMKAKSLIEKIQGKCLIVHSGGALSLTGFMDKFNNNF